MSAEPHSSSRSELEGELERVGGRIAYSVRGHGPPVLFLHAAIADRRMWDREATALAADYKTVRFDQRGYGRSPPATAPFSFVDDVKALVDHLHLEPTYLVGCSMGGATAIDFALESPARVRGLLLLAPGLTGGFDPPFLAEEQAAFDADEQQSRAIAEAWSARDRAKAIELLRQLWCPALDGPSLELFRRMVDENSSEVFEDRSAKLARSDLPPAAPRLSSIRVPTTVMVGDRDNPASELFARRIARAIPGAQLVHVPGADHLVNLSRPDRVDSTLKAALANRT